MTTAPTDYTIVSPLKPLADLPPFELTNYIRTGLRVLDTGSALVIQTVTGGYTYHFNLNYKGKAEALRANVGYTYIQQHKLSKQDILRYYGGDELVQREKHYDAQRNKPREIKRGVGVGLLRKVHNKGTNKK